MSAAVCAQHDRLGLVGLVELEAKLHQKHFINFL